MYICVFMLGNIKFKSVSVSANWPRIDRFPEASWFKWLRACHPSGANTNTN